MNRTKENVEMEQKFTKNVQKKQGKADQHISGIAGTIFAIFLVAAVLGALLMDMLRTCGLAYS